MQESACRWSQPCESDKCCVSKVFFLLFKASRLFRVWPQSSLFACMQLVCGEAY